MTDLIDRQAAIEMLEIEYKAVGILGEQWAISQCIDSIKRLPSVETIEGFDIRFLLQIAAVAHSENITTAESIEIMRDNDRLLSLFIKEQNKMISEYLESSSYYRKYGGEHNDQNSGV